MTPSDQIRGLYAVTPETEDSARLAAQVRAALEGGTRVVQYRDKSTDHALRRYQASALHALCCAHGAALIINDDVELAMEIDAHGVHLGREDGSIAAARARMGPQKLIGATCYRNLDNAERALAEGPRLAFGPDRLLYAALPAGLGFDGHPAASRPVPAVVRLTAEGRTPADGAMTGVNAHPLAFGWHPSTRELLGLLLDGPAGALVQSLDGARGRAGESKARFRAEHDGVTRLLRFDTLAANGALDLASLAAGAMRALPAGVVRLGVPVDLDGLVPGLSGWLHDLVSRDGVVYAAMSDDPTSRGSGGTTGVIVRLRR